MTDWIEQLAALAEKATPGDWIVSPDDEYSIYAWIEKCGTFIIDLEPFGFGRTVEEAKTNAALIVLLRNNVPAILALAAENKRIREEKYTSFTDGLEAAAQICGSMAETEYDDADAFEAATGCEAAIMAVVRDQRKEQARAALEGESHD